MYIYVYIYMYIYMYIHIHKIHTYIYIRPAMSTRDICEDEKFQTFWYHHIQVHIYAYTSETMYIYNTIMYIHSYTNTYICIHIQKNMCIDQTCSSANIGRDALFPRIGKRIVLWLILEHITPQSFPHFFAERLCYWPLFDVIFCSNKVSYKWVKLNDSCSGSYSSTLLYEGSPSFWRNTSDAGLFLMPFSAVRKNMLLVIVLAEHDSFTATRLTVLLKLWRIVYSGTHQEHIRYTKDTLLPGTLLVKVSRTFWRTFWYCFLHLKIK